MPRSQDQSGDERETIYRDNTRVYYTGEHTKLGGAQETFELPERYNGLGYKNLIFMVLQLEFFRAALEARVDDRPRVHIIAIEEPEAHLHPQIQCIFIKEISKALEATDELVAQVIISTHSSHIVADSGLSQSAIFGEAVMRLLFETCRHCPWKMKRL